MIKSNLLELAKEVEKEIQPQFEKIEEICSQNSVKVIEAFQDCNLQEMHLNSSTGYGIDESGRNKIEEIYAQVFKAEDALVRAQFISGTHALAITLSALLRPNDTMISITGAPYDTLQTVIGCGNEISKSSLKAYGVKYEQIELINNDFDIKKIQDRLKEQNVKLVEIQRSRGYSTRESLTIEKIENAIKAIREVNKNVIIMVDNCYGEFVQEKEPIEIGADIAVGSLMKNLGAGIATSGAYIVGKKDLINLCAERLTAPGIGKEIGPSLGQNTSLLKGLFFAPQVVASSVKTAVFASRILEKLGYDVEPKYDAKRADIVQTIKLGSADNLIKFCQGIQKGSPIDSNVVPEPSEMGGYEDEVIMAAGTFTEGSTIELSCDGPIREPFIAYMQGGLTYDYGRYGILKAIEEMQK
ncbi:aluminium resistance family protein [Clostridium sp. CAG:575]|mgnify:FL=1|nr:aluminium resistance family protein [Clostridium sp. CAG:575]